MIMYEILDKMESYANDSVWIYLTVNIHTFYKLKWHHLKYKKQIFIVFSSVAIDLSFLKEEIKRINFDILGNPNDYTTFQVLYLSQ